MNDLNALHGISTGPLTSGIARVQSLGRRWHIPMIQVIHQMGLRFKNCLVDAWVSWYRS